VHTIKLPVRILKNDLHKKLNSDDFYMIDQNFKQLKSHGCNFIGQNFYNSGQHYGNLTLYQYSLIMRKFLIVTCEHENLME
jgi:hypothetical protein